MGKQPGPKQTKHKRLNFRTSVSHRERTLECVPVNVQRLRVSEIDLRERSRVVMKRSWTKVDLLPSTGATPVD